MPEYSGGDRRPIATRSLRISQVTAGALAKAGVSANAISVVGMFAGLVAGVMLISTTFLADWQNRFHFVMAAVFIQLRLLANMLDGMVAIASGKASAVGELYNEIPDRISDTVILVAAGYAAGGDPNLGWAAASMALFVTYIRALGKGVGVPGLFQGPMSKSHRMFTLTMTCIYLAFAPAAWQPEWHGSPFPRPPGIMSAVLALIILGCLVTALRRLLRIVRALKERSR